MYRIVLLLILIFGLDTALATEREVPLEVLRMRAKLQTLAANATPTTPVRAHTFYPGSLKENITQLAAEFGWHTVVWEPDFDYQWVGLTRFHQENLKLILGHVLSDFPLQATFYNGNHVLVISPRELG